MEVVEEHIRYSPLPAGKKVKRILVIRLQATGDVVIMLPYMQSLRNALPKDTEIDLLVREECKEIPQQLELFDNIYVLGGGRNTKLQLLSFLLKLPKLRFRNYDVLLDLQNHRLSAVMRKLLGISVWSVFDRTSKNYAGKRYQDTINSFGLATVAFEKLNSFRHYEEDRLLKKFELDNQTSYIVINPAGAFLNRNWEVHNYVEFCQIWLKEVNPNARFLVLGLNKIQEKAAYFKAKLGDALIDLVGMTSQSEAILLLKKVSLVISEDSGLMHMSYVVGTPTIGILGSTRSDWTDPKLPHTHFYSSADLPCGNCMLETCIHSEVQCLTRINARQIVNSAKELLNL